MMPLDYMNSSNSSSSPSFSESPTLNCQLPQQFVPPTQPVMMDMMQLHHHQQQQQLQLQQQVMMYPQMPMTVPTYEEQLAAYWSYMQINPMTPMTPMASPLQSPNYFGMPYNAVMNTFGQNYVQIPTERELHAEHKHSNRRPYTTAQLDALRRRFSESETILMDERRVLGAKIGLTQKQVKIWFQNKRQTRRAAQRKLEAAKKDQNEEVEDKEEEKENYDSV